MVLLAGYNEKTCCIKKLNYKENRRDNIYEVNRRDIDESIITIGFEYELNSPFNTRDIYLKRCFGTHLTRVLIGLERDASLMGSAGWELITKPFYPTAKMYNMWKRTLKDYINAQVPQYEFSSLSSVRISAQDICRGAGIHVHVGPSDGNFVKIKKYSKFLNDLIAYSKSPTPHDDLSHLGDNMFSVFVTQLLRKNCAYCNYSPTPLYGLIHGHRAAINRRENTVEWRVFSSSTDPEAIVSNLQLIDSLYHYIDSKKHLIKSKNKIADSSYTPATQREANDARDIYAGDFAQLFSNNGFKDYIQLLKSNIKYKDVYSLLFKKIYGKGRNMSPLRECVSGILAATLFSSTRDTNSNLDSEENIAHEERPSMSLTSLSGYAHNLSRFV